jgi:hypothetical protein
VRLNPRQSVRRNHLIGRQKDGAYRSWWDFPMQALGQVWGRVDPSAPDLKETAAPLTSPQLYGAQTLLNVWRKPEDGFTVGRDIPSRALSSVLRNLIVFEPVEDGCDFHVRLAGTALLRRFGRDISGAKLSEIYTPAFFQRRRDWLIETIAGARPVMHRIEMQQGSRKPLGFELIYLPVLAPGRRTQWVLGGLFFFED